MVNVVMAVTNSFLYEVTFIEHMEILKFKRKVKRC